MSILGRSSALRCVHLKVSPRPRGIHETMALLRKMRQFGDVELFKNLKYEADSPAPNSFLVMYRDQEGAKRAIGAAPLHLRYNGEELVEQEAGEDGNADGGDGGSGAAWRVLARSSGLNHLAYIARQPYYATYPRTSSALFEDMHRNAPEGLYGMSNLDYARGEVPLSLRHRLTAQRKVSIRDWGSAGLMGLWKRRGRQMQQKEQEGSEEGRQSEV